MSSDKRESESAFRQRLNRIGDRYNNARHYARQRKPLDFTWRMIVLVVGISFLGLGLFFMIFPGPGWATIIVGLIILGSEYTWAKRALAPIQSTASRLAERARSREMSVRAFAVSIGAFIALTVMTYTYLAVFGATLQPIFDSFKRLIPGLN